MKRAIVYAMLPFVAIACLSLCEIPVDGRQESKPKPDSQQTARTTDGRTVILNADGTWKFAIEADISNVSIEAAIVYRSGDVKPVARTDFHLLDQSLVQIFRDADIRSGQTEVAEIAKLLGGSDEEQLVNVYALTSYVRGGGAEAFFSKALQAIKPHILRTITTDFTGKASFESIKPGSYFIIGVAKTPKRHAVWNLKIDLKPGISNVVLDNKNAVYAE